MFAVLCTKIVEKVNVHIRSVSSHMIASKNVWKINRAVRLIKIPGVDLL